MSEPVSPFRPPLTPVPLRADPPRTSWRDRIKRIFGPLLGALVLLLGKLKLLLLPILKFLPLLLKTGGTMVLSIWFYALAWGWPFAVGFVVLIFVHECGHLLAAKKFGLKVSAPMFIPFMGALIALQEAPRDAWVEACIGIGGPLLGALGAWACDGLFVLTGNPLYRGLAYSGFFLNLFNLVPIGFLDGGRIAAAISPWLWILGFIVMAGMVFLHPNLLLIFILVASIPRLFSLFRSRSATEQRYFEVSPGRRATMAALYFGLAGALVLGMAATHINPHNY